MSTSPPPAKRARGSYAKLICYNCRERRIKCQLPEDVPVEPSATPQARTTSCKRCLQQGLECVVRKTTLGRPTRKREHSASPVENASREHRALPRSPSPDVGDFVLLTLESQCSEPVQARMKLAGSLRGRPTAMQLAEAVARVFDITSALITRDCRFASMCSVVSTTTPLAVHEVITEELASLLDRYLVWQRLYLPSLPSLVKLHRLTCRLGSDYGQGLSATVLLAMLCSIALDVPSETLAPHRHLQHDLRAIVYHSGQKLLFSLPPNEYTLDVLELTTNYQPLALISHQKQAAYALNDTLYSALYRSLAQRLGLDLAPLKLRIALTEAREDEIQQLVLDTLRWCQCLVTEASKALPVEHTYTDAYQTDILLQRAFETLGEIFSQGRGPPEALFLFHTLRYRADSVIMVRTITYEWQSLPKLAACIHEHAAKRDKRKTEFQQDLATIYRQAGGVEKAMSYSQVFDQVLSSGQTDVLGLALFYAILSATPTISFTDKVEFDPVKQLNKYYTECVNHEVSRSTESAVGDFLEEFGERHIQVLETRLTEFINVSSYVSLDGILFIGPTRLMSSDILFICKEIVENQAVRIKLDGSLHPRVDVHLVLFQEAARRLEAMEANGDGPDAIARGSVFAASAKLIRSLHRILWQWKHDYVRKELPKNTQLPPVESLAENTDKLSSGLQRDILPQMGGSMDDPFADDFFTDWQNWPVLDTADLSNILALDFEAGAA